MAELEKPDSGQEPTEGLLRESEHKRDEAERLWNRETAGRPDEEMDIIAEIGRVIGSSLDIGEVYERFAVEANKLIPFDRLAVNPINPHEGIITFAYISGIDIHRWKPGDIIPIAGTFSEIVMHTRTSLLINTTGVEDITRRFPRLTNLYGIHAGIRSLITIPLISRDEVIAALHFRSKKKNAYTERDLRLAERIGAQIAGSIANAQLFTALKKAEEEQRRNRENAERLADEIAVIAEIGRLIGSTLDIEEVYERFAAEVRKLIFFDRIHVNLKDPDGENFTIVYTSGPDMPGRRHGTKVPLAGSISEAVIRTRTGLFFHPVSADEIASRFPGAFTASSFRAGMRSMMCVPLISRDEVIGCLHLRTEKTNAYTERNLRLAEEVGAQIAGAIANAQFFAALKKTDAEQRRDRENAERLAKEMTVIAEIGRLIGSTLDIDEVYERFAAMTRKLIPFDRLSITLNNPHDYTLTVAYVSGLDFPTRSQGVTCSLKGMLNGSFFPLIANFSI